MKFYETKKFFEEQKVWREKLKQHKFKDIEDAQERLKNFDPKVANWEEQEITRDYFLMLDALLTHYPEMPRTERKILELYSRGIYVRTIARGIRKSERYVYSVLKRYKGLILAFSRLQAPADIPRSLNPQSDAGSEAMDANHQTEDQAA